MTLISQLRVRLFVCLLGATALLCSGAEPRLVSAAGAYSGATQTNSTTAQRKQPPKKAQTRKAQPPTELNKLRDEYINTTKELKASLERLLALYEASQQKAEVKYEQSQKLFQAGLISRNQLEENERVITVEKDKVAGVKQQIAGADVQIAQTLIEIEGDKQMAKLGRLRKGAFVQTTSFIRYSGAGGWVLSNAGRIQNFFLQKFNRPLPVAVFGQGAIHDRWRLDHRNAMDISLNPDGEEGQALMEFMRANGIPFSAFRGAIPGVATGPHIHIGLPSHRY